MKAQLCPIPDFISYQDPLVLSAASLPAWAEELTLNSPFLFPFETRQLFFHCTAFGSSRLTIMISMLILSTLTNFTIILSATDFILRSIVWLQQQREAEQRGRGGGSALRGKTAHLNQIMMVVEGLQKTFCIIPIFLWSSM